MYVCPKRHVMYTPIKVGVHTYMTYANCQTLNRVYHSHIQVNPKLREKTEETYKNVA